MLHLPAKANKESEAKKGIVKLMLFHVHGDINIEATLVSNIIPAAPLKGMQVVLNQPCTAQASHFADLVQMTLELARQQDFISIQLAQISIWVMSKILTSHMLQGNFATKKVTSLEIKADSVEPSAFLLQRNKVLVKQELLSGSKLHLRMSWTLPTLTRPRERLQLLELVLCTPWWTSPVFASRRTRSSPPSAPTMSPSRSSIKSFSTLLPWSTIQTGYVG
jgi:hypothetical protein